MQFRLNYLLPLLAVVMFACGKPAPPETEVMEKIKGCYCPASEQDRIYRLELWPDSTFVSRRISPGALGAKPLNETCEGKYKLEFDKAKKEWLIRFNQDKVKMSLTTCHADVPVWSAEKGYLMKDSTFVINDFFDKVELTKGACDLCNL